MSKFGISNFIGFLKSYGPWADNDQQFEERVRANAAKHGLTPLEYLSPYGADIEVVKNVLAAGKSKILLICGRPGDGKTHFLGKLFENPELLNLGSEKLDELFNSPDSFAIFEDVRGFNMSAVGDFTQIPEQSASDQKLFEHILLVMADNTDSSSGSQSDKEKLDQSLFSDATAPHLLVIAGNKGKILERFNDLRSQLRAMLSKNEDRSDSAILFFGDLSGCKELFNSLDYELFWLINRLKRGFIEQTEISDKNVAVFDMSNRIDKPVIAEMFQVILGHESWDGCNNCPCASACPILRNRNLLRQPWLLQRLQNLIVLMKADNKRLTIRKVQMLIINALIGQGFEADIKTNFLTCLKVKNNITANKGSCTLYSNVYDNLLGLNFKPDIRLSHSIYKFMAELKLGVESTEAIDNFLIFDQPKYHDFRQAFLKTFDLFGLEAKLQDCYQQFKQADFKDTGTKNKKDLTKIETQFNQSLESMRRLLFFCLGAPMQEEAVIDGSIDYDNTPYLFFNPYDVCIYPHARDYIALCKLLREEKFEQVALNPAARNLILALNRQYTNLFTSNDVGALYIAATHINNLSILYSEQLFKIQAYTYNNSRAVNLLFVPENPYVPALVFKDEKFDKEGSTAKLFITPFIFENMMSLAAGDSILSLPKVVQYEMSVFRDKIFSTLETYASSLFEEGNVKGLLSSINRLEIELGGSIVPRQKINV